MRVGKLVSFDDHHQGHTVTLVTQPALEPERRVPSAEAGQVGIGVNEVAVRTGQRVDRTERAEVDAQAVIARDKRAQGPGRWRVASGTGSLRFQSRPNNHDAKCAEAEAHDPASASASEPSRALACQPCGIARVLHAPNFGVRGQGPGLRAGGAGEGLPRARPVRKARGRKPRGRGLALPHWAHRLAWSRTRPFQGRNTGSNPVGLIRRGRKARVAVFGGFLVGRAGDVCSERAAPVRKRSGKANLWSHHRPRALASASGPAACVTPPVPKNWRTGSGGTTPTAVSGRRQAHEKPRSPQPARRSGPRSARDSPAAPGADRGLRAGRESRRAQGRAVRARSAG